MNHGKVTVEEIHEMLRELAARIERGGAMTSVTVKWLTDEGEEEHTFGLETEEERDSALLAIRTILGQLH